MMTVMAIGPPSPRAPPASLRNDVTHERKTSTMDSARHDPALASQPPARTASDERFLQRYGPWAVVTGASDGIGRAIAVELARRGLSLVLVARRADRLDALAAELGRYAVSARVVSLDLAARDATARLDRAIDGLDVGLFVAGAGFGTSGSFVELTPEDELTMVDVNCRAVVEETHLFARRLIRRGRGGIVLFGSLVGFQGVPRAATYAATKAFVQSLAEGLALELKPRGVDVISSAPGPVASGFAERAGMTMGNAVTPEEVARGTLQALGRQTTVRPGFCSWFLEALMTGLPRWARSRILAKVMAGMTAHRA
jgi:short-subunit dehydrogenase